MQVHNVFLSAEAKQDLRTIQQDTYRKSHSRVVAQAYLKRIRRHLRMLAHTAALRPFYPGSSEATAACRFCTAEHHIAYFIVDKRGVRVVRILPRYRRADTHLLRD